MTGMYQDHQLQETRKIRIALEKIAKSLEKIDKSLYLSTRTPMDVIRDDILKEDRNVRDLMVVDMVKKADKGEFDTEETDIRETMHDFMKKRGEQNGLIDED